MPVPFLAGKLKGFRRMKAIEIARRLAQLNEAEGALKAYKLVLEGEPDPTEKMEAAVYILQFGKDDDYKISYTMFHKLYNQGIFRENILEIMDEAFYAPNVKLMKAHYRKNCALLEKYPYIFRKDFLKFEDLPIKFYPFDDNSYTPYYPAEDRFGAYVDFKDTVIKHYFFKDLEKPVLAEDIYSQYELEYLRDNVRKSEDVARENHIYLHYTSWAEFCAYLPCLNMKPLLEEQKVVFLFEDEISQYPIDFKARFNIDYSKFTLQPVRVREVNKMVWHTQLSSHNGGDFFNEVFDAHPNLLAMPSIMMDNIQKTVGEVRDCLKECGSLAEAMDRIDLGEPRVVEELYHNRWRTDKDILVAMYLCREEYSAGRDPASRIAPAIFFQPHFSNIVYSLHVNKKYNCATLYSEDYETVRKSPLFLGFKYIKTFMPMRRFTTSHAATVRFMYYMAQQANEEMEKGKDPVTVISDAVFERVTNRSFMKDPDDRLYRDSVLVRFEDGKLNPEATFTALSAFVDLPYTESMHSCTEGGKKAYTPGNVEGFDTASVYRTYDDFANDSERKFIEYFLRDAYEYYGYDFHYYDGCEVDQEKAEEWIDGFEVLDKYIRETWELVFKASRITRDGEEITGDFADMIHDQMLKDYIKDLHENRIKNTEILLLGLQFINKDCQTLRMIPKLELDPALLEQPLYH